MSDRDRKFASALQDSGRPVDEGRRMLEGELAKRWRISPRTLQSWRSKGRGPAYLRVCGRIIYRIEDIIEFETESIRQGHR